MLRTRSNVFVLKQDNQSAQISEKFSTLRLFLLIKATFNASSEYSDPYTWKLGFFKAIDIPMHPEPVPASNTLIGDEKWLFT